MPNLPLPLNRIYLSHSISEPAFANTPETIFYAIVTDGKRRLVRQSALTGLAQTLTTEPLPGGSVGYGGGLLAVRGNTLVYAAKDNRLHGIDLTTGEPWPITPAYEGVAAPAISPNGQLVAGLCEQGGKCNVLLVDVRGKALPVKISNDPWYAFNPAFSPDGARLAWQEWDEMDMPWDAARLQIALFAEPNGQHPYALLPVHLTTLARPGVTYAAPQFSPDGKYLAYTSDETGWRSLWAAEISNGELKNAVRVNAGEGEIGGPDWVPGLIPMRWSSDGKSIYAIRRHHSRDTLLHITWPEKTIAEIQTPWTEISGLNVCGDALIFIGANPSTPATLVTLNVNSGQETPRATGAVGLLNPASLTTAEVITWQTAGNVTAWGIWHRAMGAPGPRPLIVNVHGGPTSETPLTWSAQAQYFATRGWHYLSVNHRGGSGFGRAYQDLLNGQWGVADVEDARTGAEYLIGLGQADPRRVVITGGSAGGYTTLMALTHDPDFWAAGISLFGIGNLYDLKQGSHRFEVNYEQRLIGRLPEAGPLWKERSPLTHVQNVRAPVLLFHGTEDKAVPHQQSVEFSEAVKRRGGVAELISYEGEGHGFLKEANRRDVIEKMERFLDKYVLCLQK